MYRKFFSAFILTLLVLTFALPASVAANHDSCSGSDDAPEQCVTAQRAAATENCVENSGGDQDAVDTCGQGIVAHFNFTGAPEDAPALPSSAQPPAATQGAVKNDCKGDNIQAGLPETDDNHCGILDYLQLFINVLSGIVGVVIAAMIIIGGIQYSASGDNPQAVEAAKKRISNAILALFIFVFMFAFLNWLVPGGVLR